MKENDIVTREKIILCTLELIQKESDYAQITIRKIVQNAGVSLSAVNYHFGSKEKLINEVISRPIQQYMASQPNPYEIFKNEPVEMLKSAIKLPTDYIADNPNISRVSILSDMTSPLKNDLAVQTMQYWRPAVKAVFPQLSENEVGLILWEISSIIQTAFLRHENFRDLTGINYFNKTDRDRFLDEFIDDLIKRKNK